MSTVPYVHGTFYARRGASCLHTQMKRSERIELVLYLISMVPNNYGFNYGA